MLEISVELLDIIKKKCEDMYHYRVGIICPHRERARELQEALLREWPGTERAGSLESFDICFGISGSFVRILTYGDIIVGRARGNRFYELYMDTTMPDINNNISAEINCMVVPYRNLARQFTSNVDLQGYEYDFEEYDRELEAMRELVRSLDPRDFTYTEQRKAPDFGEFAPSQELNSFLESLT